MFLVRLFWDTLYALGLYQKKARIIFLGLDNAGKTTLLHILRDDKLSVHEPTRHPQMEELKIGNICFRACDMGGHVAARRLWRQYLADVDGVVFLVDSVDDKRFPEVRHELSMLLDEEALTRVPFLVLGNKIDVNGAYSEADLERYLGITDALARSKKTPGTRPMRLFMCSVVNRTGHTEGFRWLAGCL